MQHNSREEAIKSDDPHKLQEPITNIPTTGGSLTNKPRAERSHAPTRSSCQQTCSGTELVLGRFVGGADHGGQANFTTAKGFFQQPPVASSIMKHTEFRSVVQQLASASSSMHYTTSHAHFIQLVPARSGHMPFSMKTACRPSNTKSTRWFVCWVVLARDIQQTWPYVSCQSN